MRGSQWQQEQSARIAVVGASLAAKLARLPARQFQSAIRSIEKSLKKDPDASTRQDPQTQRALMLEWAESLGLKVERHNSPVI